MMHRYLEGRKVVVGGLSVYLVGVSLSLHNLTEQRSAPSTSTSLPVQRFPALVVMAAMPAFLRLLRLLPALSSTATLQFALDEHLIFGTWVHPSLRTMANTHLPSWWTKGGLRWRWILIVGYPANYIFAIANILVARDQLELTASTWWYTAGLAFSVAHMLYVRMALGLIAAVENDVPRGNVVRSMAGWLRMNWIRGLTTDFPAFLCFTIAALKAL